MPLKGQGKRIRHVLRAVSEKLGRLDRPLTLGEFGELVGRTETARGKPYSATGVSEWMQERNEPSIPAFMAMAKLSGLPFVYVTIGEDDDDEAVPTFPLVQARSDAEKASSSKKRGTGRQRRA